MLSGETLQVIGEHKNTKTKITYISRDKMLKLDSAYYVKET